MRKLLILYFWIAAIPLLTQTRPAQKPAFEVVSVKLNTSGDGRFFVGSQPGGRFIAHATLSQLVRFAFKPQLPDPQLQTLSFFLNAAENQMIGGPSWVGT